MSQLLLISPPENYFPFSFAFVMQSLHQNGIPYRFVDMSFEQDIETIVSEGDYFAVASGGLFTSFFPVTEIIDRVKKIRPQLPAIIGGRATSVIPFYLYEEHTAADYLLFGEAEIRFPSLVQHIAENHDSPPTHIDGIAYRKGGKLHKTPPAKWLDLSATPIKARWDEVQLDHYLDNTPSVPNTRMMPVVTGLGCVGKCTFCAPATGAFRARPVSDVIDELHELSAKYDFNGFYFLTEIFYPSLKQIKDFCDAYIRSGINKPWKALLRSDVDPEALEHMVEAGCKFVTMGIETADDGLLQLMNKKTNVENGRRLIRKGHELGLSIHTSIIFGNVGETDETIRKTVDFVSKERVQFDSAYLTVYPGTKLYQDAVADGRITNEYKYIKELEFTFPGSFNYNVQQYLNVSGMPTTQLFEATANELPRAMASKYDFCKVSENNLENMVGKCRVCGNDLPMPFQPWAPFEMDTECPECWTYNTFFVMQDPFFEGQLDRLTSVLEKKKRVAVYGTDLNACFIQNYGQLLGLPPSSIACFLTFSSDDKSFFDKELVSLDTVKSLDVDHVIIADTLAPEMVSATLEKLGISTENQSRLIPDTWFAFLKRFIEARSDLHSPKDPIFFPHNPMEIRHIASVLAKGIQRTVANKGVLFGFTGGFAKHMYSEIQKLGITTLGFIATEACSDDDMNGPLYRLGDVLPENLGCIIPITPSYNAQKDLQARLLRHYPQLTPDTVLPFTNVYLDALLADRERRLINKLS